MFEVESKYLYMNNDPVQQNDSLVAEQEQPKSPPLAERFLAKSDRQQTTAVYEAQCWIDCLVDRSIRRRILSVSCCCSSFTLTETGCQYDVSKAARLPLLGAT